MLTNKHHIDRNPENNSPENIIVLPMKFHSGIHKFVGCGKTRKTMPTRGEIEYGLAWCEVNDVKLNTLAWEIYMEHIEKEVREILKDKYISVSINRIINYYLVVKSVLDDDVEIKTILIAFNESMGSLAWDQVTVK